MENKNTLAKIALGINAVLIILIIILFINMNNKENSVVSSDEISTNDSLTLDDINTSAASQPTGEIAFFNLDTLNSKLLLFTEIKKQIEDAGKSAENKMKRKQKEIAAWKSKWEKKGQLLSNEEAQYMQEAESMQRKAAEFEQNVQMKFAQEQDQWMQTYAIRLSNFTNDFAEEKGLDAIFAYTFGQSPWYYNPALDITDQLAEIMNAEYKRSTESTKD